ncbi:MAG: DUF523 domain-containing protein [Magnetococcales bacterium]|nr:DUF523 domain-containing protein [Magnetococcales bacterium]
MAERVVLGVSACLLGERVRYDGRDKHDPDLIAWLAPRCILVPVCPEVEAGLGVPRAPMRLEGDPCDPRVVVLATRQDVTDLLVASAEKRLAELVARGVRGLILTPRSPSCGVGSTPVYAGEQPVAVGDGLFVRVCRRCLPGVPVVEAVRPWSVPAVFDKIFLD